MRIISYIGMSQNFSKAKIYKLANDFIDDVYVGSTCNTLIKRFSCHKCRSIKNPSTKLHNLMNEIGCERFRI